MLVESQQFSQFEYFPMLNFSVKTRLGLGLVLILIFQVVVGIIGYISAGKLSAETARMYDQDVVGAREISAAQNTLWLLRYDISQYISNPEKRKKIVEDSPKYHADFDAHIANYAASGMSAEEKKSYDALMVAYAEYKDKRPGWLALMEAGKIDEAAEYRSKTILASGSTTVKALTALIEASVKAGVDAKKEADEHANTTRIQILSVVGSAIFLGIVIAFLLSRSINKPLKNLEQTMRKISETDDLSLRAKVLRNDEFGSMATEFNAMVDKLALSNVLLKKKMNDIHTMLQNMPQGLLTIDENNHIQQYSAHLEKILESSEIAGKNVVDLLFENSNLGQDEVAQISAIGGACVGEDAMNFEFNQHLLVSEIEKTTPSGVKVLDLNWAAVINEDDMVEQLLVCVRDVTDLRRLSQEANEQKRNLEIIGEILSVSHEKFFEFITTAIKYIDEIEFLIRENVESNTDALNSMFRNMHTIKGNARTYGLRHLTNLVHEIEQTYDDLRKDVPDIAWEQSRLLEQLSELRMLVEHYAKTNEVSLGRKGAGRRGNSDKYLLVDKKKVQETIHDLERVNTANLQELLMARDKVHNILRLLGTESLETTLSGIVDSLGGLATQLQKETPNVQLTDNGYYLTLQAVGVIKDVFMHLFRNSLDHGLETPDERTSVGKSPTGTIKVDLRKVDDKARISIRDDGRGIALAKIKEIAISKGFINPDDKISDIEIANQIFKPGFSTTTTVTDISGRGVGMDAVLGFARKEGGEVKIAFLDDAEGANFRQFAISVYLPQNMIVHSQVN